MNFMYVIAYVGVELANEAGEVVVLEVVREEVTGELGRAPNDEGGVVFAPRDDVVGGRIIHELVRFGKEGSRHRLVRVQGEQYALTIVYHQSH